MTSYLLVEENKGRIMLMLLTIMMMVSAVSSQQQEGSFKDQILGNQAQAGYFFAEILTASSPTVASVAGCSKELLL